MVDFGKSDKMIKISGKADKTNNDKIQYFVLFSRMNEILNLCFDLSAFPLIFIISLHG